MSVSPFLVTKFTIPPLRAHFLPRTHLIERLDQHCTLPLVLLSAGAGFGKTTLLAAWAGQRPHLVAWLSLDHLDNDPLHFWSMVLAALRTRLPALGETALGPLHESSVFAPTLFLTELINDLAASEEQIVLILDDYHLIEEASIHASLLFLLEHAPSCLHLIISSRVDPPLMLSRLRARGQLAEIRDRDLRIDEQETASFLQQVMGLHLDTADAQLLAQRTEGWLAGLQLAALPLSTHPDPSTWVAAFHGSQRLLLDYLQEEILDRQKPSIRRFLLRVCVLPRMNAALCQAVTGKADSQQLLEELERSNLFVTPLDEQRQWYRFHDLFREALLARLQVSHPDLVPRLYQRAACWYEAQGLLADAIEALLKSQSFERAVRLIHRYINWTSFRNEYQTLCRWLEQLPDEVMRAQPRLSLFYAVAIMFTSARTTPAAWARIERPLFRAEQVFRAQAQWERLGEALELYAELAFFQGDFASMFVLGQQAFHLLPQESIFRGANVGLRGMEQLLAGHLDLAWQYALESCRIAEQVDLLPLLLTDFLQLGEICEERGDLHLALHYYRQVLARAEENLEMVQQQLITGSGGRENFYVSWIWRNLAQLSYEWNDLAAAAHALSQVPAAEESSRQECYLLIRNRFVQPLLLHRRGETTRAQELLERWENQARWSWELRAIHAFQARLSLERGDLAVVEQWHRTKEQRSAFLVRERDQNLPLLQQQEEALLLVRLYIAQKHVGEALTELAPWKERARDQGRMRSLLEILILEAHAHFTGAELSQARHTLLQALQLAQPQHFQRLFLDEGRPLQALLKSTLPQIQEPELAAFARHLLNAFAQEQASAPGRTPSPLIEPLTPQEQRILRLLAEGASNQEIANQLVISLGTVKKHMTNLLGKLEATNRTQALVRAREYGLL
jgi:LuxR family maltose regulon positive regulatory protein